MTRLAELMEPAPADGLIGPAVLAGAAGTAVLHPLPTPATPTQPSVAGLAAVPGTTDPSKKGHLAC